MALTHTHTLAASKRDFSYSLHTFAIRFCDAVDSLAHYIFHFHNHFAFLFYVSVFSSLLDKLHRMHEMCERCAMCVHRYTTVANMYLFSCVSNSKIENLFRIMCKRILSSWNCFRMTTSATWLCGLMCSCSRHEQRTLQRLIFPARERKKNEEKFNFMHFAKWASKLCFWLFSLVFFSSFFFRSSITKL